MSVEFEISEVFSATPEQVYDAWLDSEGHSEMTGVTRGTNVSIFYPDYGAIPKCTQNLVRTSSSPTYVWL